MFSILFPAQKLLSEQAPLTHKHQHFHPLQQLYSSANQTRTRPIPTYITITRPSLSKPTFLCTPNFKRAKQHNFLNAHPRSHNIQSHNYSEHSHSPIPIQYLQPKLHNHPHPKHIRTYINIHTNTNSFSHTHTCIHKCTHTITQDHTTPKFAPPYSTP